MVDINQTRLIIERNQKDNGRPLTSRFEGSNRCRIYAGEDFDLKNPRDINELEKVIQRELRDPSVKIDKRKIINFSGEDYLSEIVEQ